MTETGYRYGVCALRAKRSEIAGQIGQLKIQEAQLRRDLARVDDVLRILAPGSDPAKIPARKAIKHLNIFRQGQLSQIVLGILRASGRPMSNLEITAAISKNGGFGPEAWTPMRRRVRANLAYLHEQGRVVKTGFGETARWSLLEQP